MAGEKISVTFEIQPDAEKMLEHAVSKYGLTDKNKALRCLLDYLAVDADWDQIFSTIRCIRCGDDVGWELPESK